MSKTWLVTGAARGIGAGIVKAALQAGDRVAASGRDAAKVAEAFDPGPALFAVKLDVTDEPQAHDAVQAVVEHFGRIDVLVNNAGYGQLGVFEENEPADVERQFATNVFGVFNVTRAVLPVMRRQRSGRIFNLSSIAGVRGARGGSLYSATKFAVEGFSEALAAEVASFGITVTIVQPGFFRTDFLDASSLRRGGKQIADYAELSSAVHAAYDARNHQQIGDPAKLAAVIVDLAGREKPPMRFAAGSDAVEIVATKIDAWRSEFERWRALSVTTDGQF